MKNIRCAQLLVVCGGAEMADSGSFVAKPVRGWLHPDAVLASDGVTYAVRVSFPCDIYSVYAALM